MSKKSKLLEQVRGSLVQPQTLERPDEALLPPEPWGADGVKRMRNAKLIPFDSIDPDPQQPRTALHDETLEELAASIQRYGLLQPISVEAVEGGRFRLISGERRYRAAQLVGLSELPCIVQNDVAEADRYARQLIENLQREDLSPIDKARALLHYKSLLPADTVWQEVETAVGLSSRRRKQILALLNLPPHLQSELVATGGRASKNQITEKHARALLLLNHKPQQQQALYDRIKKSSDPIPGDAALALARELKGQETLKTFRVTYRDRADLLSKLLAKIAELQTE